MEGGREGGREYSRGRHDERDGSDTTGKEGRELQIEEAGEQMTT